MAIREKLEEHRGLTTAIATVMILIGLVAVAYQLFGGQSSSADALAGEAFYSVDDGKTYFAAPAERVPPFEHEGKEAVLVRVFDCDGERFVGYLERYAPEAHKVIVASRDPAAAKPQAGNQPPAFAAALGPAMTEGREVKKPGENGWVRATAPEGTKITQVRCPGGKGEPQPVGG